MPHGDLPTVLSAADVFVLPTASEYDPHDLINLGTHYYTVQAVYALTYMDPNGLNADVKFGLSLNRSNKDTAYRSGNELNIDYALGWGLGNGWVVGVGGHVFSQVTNDSGPGSAQGK